LPACKLEKGIAMKKPHSRSFLPISLFLTGILIVLSAVACAGSAGLPAGPTPRPATASALPTLTSFPLTVVTTSGTPVQQTMATPTVGQASVSFAHDVLPILLANCSRCHGDTTQYAGLNFTTYANVMAYASYGIVVPGDASNSILFQVIAEGVMPADGSQVPAKDLRTISQWIDAGASNN
jgi:uncharacterized membrane protein